MAMIQVASIEAPIDEPALIGPTIALLRRAIALGFLGPDEVVDHLDLALVRRIARDASNADIGQDVAVALLHGDPGSDRLAGLIRRLDEALTASPLPDRELPGVLRVLDREGVAGLIGTSSVSLGRYQAGARTWPDQLAARIHWLALLLADLAGAYNEFGSRRWFDRRRSQLGGRSPREVLVSGWDPADPDVEQVRELAAALAGAGAAT